VRPLPLIFLTDSLHSEPGEWISAFGHGTFPREIPSLEGTLGASCNDARRQRMSALRLAETLEPILRLEV